jgi:hypothetical protein
MILLLAKEYGQAPQDVEDWDQYWLERAALKIEGESIHNIREASRAKSKSKRR